MTDAATDHEPAARRGRTGGREGRLRGRSGPAVPAYIRRAIPPYEIMGEEGLVAIEDHADRILQEVGMEIRGDAEAVAMLVREGAEADGWRVRFPPGMLRAIIQRSAPATFVQHARNPARSVTMGGDACVLAPSYGSPFVADLDQGRRYATLQDFRNFVRLASASPWLHHQGGTVCEPTDVPVNKRHLDMVDAHIRYGDKAFMGSVTGQSRAEDSIEMCRIVFGADFVDRNCTIIALINVNSPLVLDGEASRVLRAYARANQCAICTPFILGGAMGPVTTAGALAQCLGEAMVLMALAQLERPGAPVIFGSFLSSMSLRSGAPTFGTPEATLGYLVLGQLARRLGVPLRCGGHLCGSKVPDAQAGFESAHSMWPAFVGGANFILHSAGWAEAGLVMSYEKFVMDAEQCGAFSVLARGLPLDENAFAMSAFHEAGPGQHFLGTAHTVANYETAYFDFRLPDNNSFEQWAEEGSRDMVARANPVWKQVLAETAPPPLDPGIEEALADFVARRKASMPDAWY
jgi:trimethylamine--corrinoid protein Co-methyltransferase